MALVTFELHSFAIGLVVGAAVMFAAVTIAGRAPR